MLSHCLKILTKAVTKKKDVQCIYILVRSYQTENSPEAVEDSAQPPHIPILKDEITKILDPQPGKVFFDMTFGSGGHSAALLQACPDIKVYALDRDKKCYSFCSQLQSLYSSNSITWIHGKFTDLLNKLEALGLPSHHMADGVLFDVGASSMQYDDRRRGFSLNKKGPLDMRMDRDSNDVTAADVVNRLEEKDLHRILKKYAEEKQSHAIARKIVETRQMLGPIQTTRELQDIVKSVYDGVSKTDKLGRQQHPATLTFQALRIFVNDELNELYNGLKIANRVLKPQGKCAVLTFHSLEHKIVHQSFNHSDARLHHTLITPDLEYNFCNWVTDGSVARPSAEEVQMNPRSRSAQLRVATKPGPSFH